MTAATPPSITLFLLLPPLFVLTSALLTPLHTFTVQREPCSQRNPPSWRPHQRQHPQTTPRHKTTSLHQQKQLLQPQKGGIVVESPPDGFIVRDILVDMLLGRDGDSHGEYEQEAVLFGGDGASTFSPRSRATSPPMPPQRDETLPLFPNLKSIASDGRAGPRRISPGESAVFERAVTAKYRARSNPPSNGRIGAPGASGGTYPPPKRMEDVRRGGVSIRGDSSMLRSAGFVGAAAGGSTRVFSSASGGTSFGGSSASLDGGNDSNSGYGNNNGGSNGSRVGKNNNSFRNGTGRDYSSAAGTKFGNIGGSSSKNHESVPSGGQQRSGVSIKGDASMFSSTGFMSGNDFVRNGSGGGRNGVSPPRRTSAPSTAYNSQHYFDANASPSYNAYGGQSIHDIHSSSASTTPSNTPSNYKKQAPSVPVGSSHSNPHPSQTKKYNSGQSLGDNFLSASHSVKRSHDPDDDDYDEDMLGYESPNRRGEGFLTAPDPYYINQPVHNGKWISELYAEQGLDVLSGGMEGFGAVMGEMRKGGDFGGRSAAAGGGGGYGSGSSNGYGGDVGYGNSNSHGYGSDTSYRNSNGYGGDHGYGNNDIGYGSSDVYGNGNSNGYRTGGDVGFGGFRGAPAQGY